MSKIRIKNFGPIKQGYNNDGFEWMDIKKVTVFIGNQGSGKSTVAKLISTCSWMEKAINRGDLDKGAISFDAFKKICGYQGIQNYFHSSTVIEYAGEAFYIKYDERENFPIIIEEKSKEYFVPKIMYVPAERNFLSVLKNAFDVKGLPESLFTFAEEYRRSQQELEGKLIELPINEYKFQYDDQKDTSFIIGDDYKLNLTEASSGVQSLIPLYLVSRNLAEFIESSEILDPEHMTVSQKIRMNNEISKIMRSKTLLDNEKIDMVHEVEAKFQNTAFINIVEEPEQNLFPTSQHELLNTLLEFNNMNAGNKFIMTTHSPYLINYLTLSVKANMIKDKIATDILRNKLQAIVPLTATIKPDDLVVYELDEKNGTIRNLGSYNGLPSDENELNELLGESNEQFAQLLEIQQSI